jgi:hypothetical protein
MPEVKQYERPFYYNSQLRRYLVQFMAIFGSFEVMLGWNEDKAPRLAPIPIANASKDRVVAWIKNQQTQNQMIRLPLFSASMSSIDLNPDMRKGVAQQRRNTMMPTGGLFPDDIKVVQQRMPVPYKATFELGIWSSNTDQHNQILEQIFAIFDPTLNLQTSDEVMDWTRLTTLKLTNIRSDENVPAGLDRRIIQTYLEFEVPIWISIPADVHKRFVEKIFLRVGAVSQMADTSEDIIAELNALGVQYEEIADVNDINIQTGIPGFDDDTDA